LGAEDGIVTEADNADTLDGKDSAAFVLSSGHTTAAHDALDIDADTLDGRDVTQVRPSAAWWSQDNLPNNDLSEDVTVTVPVGGGTLLMVGSFDYFNSTSVAEGASCQFLIDGALLDESFKAGSRATAFNWGQCGTDAARGVTAGTHTVTFESGNLSLSTLDPDAGTFHVIVIPNP
jgi:hypothetical protein